MGILKVEIKEIKEEKKQKTKVRNPGGWQIFSIKGKMINILGFRGQKAKSITYKACLSYILPCKNPVSASRQWATLGPGAVGC